MIFSSAGREFHPVLSTGTTTIFDGNAQTFVAVIGIFRNQHLQLPNGGLGHGYHSTNKYAAKELTVNVGAALSIEYRVASMSMNEESRPYA